MGSPGVGGAEKLAQAPMVSRGKGAVMDAGLWGSPAHRPAAWGSSRPRRTVGRAGDSPCRSRQAVALGAPGPLTCVASLHRPAVNSVNNAVSVATGWACP